MTNPTDMQANTMTADMFNFGAMKEVAGDPFKEEKGAYARDERFYALGKDKDGNGGALVRFLPDSERAMIQRMFKCNANVVKDGKKRFVSEFSPQTIGLPCPFQDKWSELYNAGLKDEAKVYARGVTFIANIKIIKDPANPENEGKIFMYQMSGAIKDKIQKAMTPSEQDVALGKLPKEMFNPLNGHSFRLACSRGANGQINYDASEIVAETSSIYDSVEDAVTDIKTNTYTLSDLLKPDQFMTFDELVKKMAWVNFEGQASTPKVNTLTDSAKVPAQEPAPQQAPQPIPQAEPAPQPIPQAEPAPQQAPASGGQSIDDLLGQL